MIGSQSILNQDWYNRLVNQIREQANVGIRATGSDPSDPFWAARASQGISDLNRQRQDAMRAMMEQGNIMRRGGYEREKEYQRRVTWGMNRPDQQTMKPSAYLGVQGEDFGGAGLPGGVEPGTAPGMPIQQPEMGLGGGLPAPEAYRPPMSGGFRLPRSAGVMSGQVAPMRSFSANAPRLLYNPAQFGNPALDRRQRELDAYYARMARGWR